MSTKRMRNPVGAHVSVAGGLARRGLRHAAEVGAEVIQVFVTNPRGWALAQGNPAEDAKLRTHIAAQGLPVFIHSPYLVNFGSPTASTVERSVTVTRHLLMRGRQIGACGVVVHTGSAVTGTRDRALRQIRDHLLPLLDEIPEDGPEVLLEPMAGQGHALCAKVGDLAPFLAALDYHPRLGVCLDTCHAFAAGHDLAAPDGVGRMLDELVAAAGGERLKLIHANDSADPCGSCRDRHEHIGTGHIGERPFFELMRHPATQGVPIVIETPGPAEVIKRVEMDRRNIETLKRLRAGPSRQQDPLAPAPLAPRLVHN